MNVNSHREKNKDKETKSDAEFKHPVCQLCNRNNENRRCQPGCDVMKNIGDDNLCDRDALGRGDTLKFLLLYVWSRLSTSFLTNLADFSILNVNMFWCLSSSVDKTRRVMTSSWCFVNH